MEYAEFEDMMASQMGDPITADDMKYYFKKFDANGDGFISSDELALVMKTFGGKSYSKKEIDDMIAQADVDADGKVSYTGTSLSQNFDLSPHDSQEKERDPPGNEFSHFIAIVPFALTSKRSKGQSFFFK